MRKLKADEIECRVSQISEKGCTLLLYKTARVDRAILDEEFGQYSWQNDFKVIDGKMYGGIGVYSNDLSEWIWKWDCGTESNTEAEKGQASDCFKRAGFKWGIGVELYSAPFIFVKVDTVKDEYASKKAGKDVYKLVNKYQKFRVSQIGYADNGDINRLEIVDEQNKDLFRIGRNTEYIELTKNEREIDEHIKNIKGCQNRSELDLYWGCLDNKTKINPRFRKELEIMCKKYPKMELVRDEVTWEVKEVQS